VKLGAAARESGPHNRRQQRTAVIRGERRFASFWMYRAGRRGNTSTVTGFSDPSLLTQHFNIAGSAQSA
jgi:hypothetical protein